MWIVTNLLLPQSMHRRACSSFGSSMLSCRLRALEAISWGELVIFYLFLTDLTSLAELINFSIFLGHWKSSRDLSNRKDLQEKFVHFTKNQSSLVKDLILNLSSFLVFAYCFLHCACICSSNLFGHKFPVTPLGILVNWHNNLKEKMRYLAGLAKDLKGDNAALGWK